MFQVIFKHELAFWSRKAIVYFFGLFLFSISFVSMWGMASEAPDVDVVFQNSSYKLNYLINFISQLMVFIIPAIIGMSIYRDFNSRIYTLLYSYPFTKIDYLLGKFLSSFMIVVFISLCIGVGLWMGTIMPGVNENALKDFNLSDYIQVYSFFTIPNILLMSIIVFSIVSYSRNIYIGFIAIILLTIINRISAGLFNSWDLLDLAGIADPFGESSVKNIVRFWTLEERNNHSLPINSIIIANRLIWISISMIIAFISYKKFNFNQFVSSTKSKNIEVITVTKRNKINAESLAQVNYNFSFLSQLKTMWKLSNFDFKYILKSWPFISLIIVGGIMVYLQQSQAAPKFGFKIFPTTAQMLQIPLFIFSPTINVITFLYMGIIIYRAKKTRIDSIINITPQANWVYLTSKLIAIFKIQMVLLSIVLITGLFAQTVQAYYRFEIMHYLFELYFLQFVHFSIWAITALFMHTIFKNLYISFFLCALIPLTIIILPDVSNALNIPFLKESILQYNMVPNMFLGFEYSDFNQYGTGLIIYLLYKFYWLSFTLILFILTVVFWKREFTFTIKERWNNAWKYSNTILKTSLFIAIAAFISLAAKIYHEEHQVSRTNISEKEQDQFAIHNEKEYGKYLHLIQPRIAKAIIDMQIDPNNRDFLASGRLFFVNKDTASVDTIIVAKSYKDSTNIKILNAHHKVLHDNITNYELLVLQDILHPGDSLIMQFDVRNFKNSFLHDNSRVLENGTFINASILPRLGIRNVFIENKKKRKKYGLNERTNPELLPSNVDLLSFSYAENNMEFIEYESTITTDKNHKAFTVGSLFKEEILGDKIKYHYKSIDKIRNNFAWMSGDYVLEKDSINGIQLQLFRHENHDHNYKSIFEGIKASIQYCEEHFTPLQFENINIIEFPLSYGSYATLVGNLMPYSESQFLCSHNHKKDDEFNYLYYSSAHEVSHYWWGQQIDPANIRGGKMITESVAEYIASRVYQKEYGIKETIELRKKFMNIYFETRAYSNDEVPLYIVNDEQEYIAYQKGNIVMNQISEYLGENKFNKILSSYLKDHTSNNTYFANSYSFLDTLESQIPDSLQYLINDLFKTISISENSIQSVNISKSDSLYINTIELAISKYRSDHSGNKIYKDESNSTIKIDNKSSLNLKDYVQIELLGKDNQRINKTILIEKIETKVNIRTDFKPIEIVLDPLHLIIEKNKKDNHWKNI